MTDLEEFFNILLNVDHFAIPYDTVLGYSILLPLTYTFTVLTLWAEFNSEDLSLSAFNAEFYTYATNCTKRIFSIKPIYGSFYQEK